MNFAPSYRIALLLMMLLGARDLRAAENWPGFRGAGDSHARAQNLPWSWESRGRGAGNWSIRLPGYGQSSPVVWNDRVFVTAVSGEEKENLHVLAVALADGKILWQRDFQGTQRIKDSDTVSRGAPTPVVDADRLYAVFESGDVFALTHAGELVWLRSFVKDYGEVQGPHGYASSSVLVNDLCIVQVAHAGPSYVLALEKATGMERWRTPHPSQTGWSTPGVLTRNGRAQIILSTSGSVRAVNAETGREEWCFADLQGNSTASPTIAGNYVAIGASTERAVGRMREAAESDAGATAGSLVLRLGTEWSRPPSLQWRSAKISTSYSSPLALDGLIYFVNKVGVVQCVEMATGKILWQHRLPSETWASPIANNGHTTFFCKHGQVVTLKGGPELVEVAESQVSTTEVVYGVAAVDSSWIVRTGRGLIRISNPTSPQAPKLAESTGQ